MANGTWSVGLSCGGGEDSLDSQGYQCVPEQPATVANNNVVINFIVQPCGALQVTSSSPLPDALATAYYSYFLEASGCYWPFTWSLAPGSQPLPPGMNLWPNGNLEGTPTAGGTYTFAVRVTDNHGSWTDRSLSLRVNAIPTLSSPSRPSASQFRFQVNGVAGQTYTIQGSPDLNNWQNLGVTNAPDLSALEMTEGRLRGRPSVKKEANTKAERNAADACCSTACKNA